MTLQQYLSSIHTINNEDFQLINERLRIKHFKKGQHLVLPGEIQKEIYFVKTGVLMYSFDTESKINILGFAYPPYLAAIIESFFLQKPARYHLTSLTSCEVGYITFDSLQELFDSSITIERLFRKLAETVGAGLINRQIELRSTTIEERFVSFCRRSPHLLQLVPHKYIASYLDIDSTNFSKLFNSIKF